MALSDYTSGSQQLTQAEIDRLKATQPNLYSWMQQSAPQTLQVQSPYYANPTTNNIGQNTGSGSTTSTGANSVTGPFGSFIPKSGAYPTIDMGGTTARQLFDTYAQKIGSTMPSLYDTFKNVQPTQIKGMDPRYYETQRAAMKDALRSEFFGPVGTLQQVASGESAAGRLGSGVGDVIIQETAMQPYANAMVDIDRNILSAQLEERSRVETFNAEQMGKYNEFKAGLMQADQTADLQLADIANRAAQMEYGTMTNQQVAQLESDMEIMRAAMDSYVKQYANYIDYLGAQNDYLRTLSGGQPIKETSYMGDVAGDMGFPWRT